MLDLSQIQYNSEHPTLMAITYTVLCAVLLGILLVFTYDKTTRDVKKAFAFMQGLVLITIVAAMIMQAIGDSIARGLGMLGALSIIRFRTTVRNPRNIVFMFAALAAGIACGVFGFITAIIGTIAFCLTAFVLRYSKFNPKNQLIGRLRLEMPIGYTEIRNIEKVIRKHCSRSNKVTYRLYTSERRANLCLHVYEIKLSKDENGAQLLEELNRFEQLRVATINFSNASPDGI